MAWLRIESNFTNHRKVMAAGQSLGRNAVARVIGVWTVGACYAVAHLTDGWVPGIILEDTRYDRRPKDVIAAMVHHGLLHIEADGYRLHDFHDYNPSAADVKAKRRADLTRKRAGVPKDSAQIPTRFQRDSAPIPHRIAADSEKIPEVPNPSPNPKKKDQDQEQCADAHAVLVKLAHAVLDDISRDADAPPISELSHRLGDLAVRYDIPYLNSRTLTKAMDSALVQRRRAS